MKCPKCGMDLTEINFAGVSVDKCFHCEGMWFDKGEVDLIEKKEHGFVGRMLGVFR
jgi:Zn-finger nucleic acid-binding protein